MDPPTPPLFTIVVFMIETQRYGVSLQAVERIIRLIDYTPLPQGPEIVAGVIDFQGAVIPVINLRKRFGLPAREPRLSDHLILGHTRRRRVALLADEACGLETVCESAWIPAPSILPRTGYLAGAVKRKDGLILIHDLDACLSLDEEHALDLALTEVPAS